jgi:hypothetical protein
MSQSNDPTSLKKVPTTRLPKKDDTRLRTPIVEMVAAVQEFAPKVGHWWITTYGVVASFLPIDQRKLLPARNVDKNDLKCSTQSDRGDATACPNEAKYVSVGLFVNQKAPIKVMECRVRNFCPSCLYVSMTKALSKVMRPEFFRKSEQNADEADPDSIYIVSERAEYLQHCIQEVVGYMEINDPTALEALNERIMADSDKE